MKASALLFAVAAATTLGLPALADAQVFVSVNGEDRLIISTNPVPGLTREQKRAQDLAEAEAEAGRGDGFRFVGGEAGWRYVGHVYARVKGEWVCVDGIDHNGAVDRGARDLSIVGGA